MRREPDHGEMSSPIDTIMDGKKREGGMTNRFWLCVLFAAVGCARMGAQTNTADAPKPIPRTSDGKPDFTGFFNLQYTPNMAMGKEDLVPTRRPEKPLISITMPRTIPPRTAGSQACHELCNRRIRRSSSNAHSPGDPFRIHAHVPLHPAEWAAASRRHGTCFHGRLHGPLGRGHNCCRHRRVEGAALDVAGHRRPQHSDQ